MGQLTKSLFAKIPIHLYFCITINVSAKKIFFIINFILIRRGGPKCPLLYLVYLEGMAQTF